MRALCWGLRYRSSSACSAGIHACPSRAFSAPWSKGTRALPVIATCACAGIIVGVVVQTGRRPYCRWDYYAGRRPLILNALLYDDCLSDIGDGLADNGQLCRDCYDGGSGAGAGVGCADIGRAYVRLLFRDRCGHYAAGVSRDLRWGRDCTGQSFSEQGNRFQASQLPLILCLISLWQILRLLLIDYEPAKLAISVVTALIGMVGISGSVIGFLIRPTHAWERLALFPAGMLLIIPQLALSAVGLAIVLGILCCPIQTSADDGACTRGFKERIIRMAAGGDCGLRS